MKVCFFAHYSITNSDGATLSMYNIIDEMLRRGIEVVVVLANTRSLEGRIAEGKIKFIVAPLYGMRMDLNKKTPMTQVKFFVKSICNSIQKRKIEKVLKSYLQPIITQYFIDNKSEIWLLFLIAHSKR